MNRRGDPWIPPPMWEGETAYVIGGGPSVRGMRLEVLRRKCVIGVNQAFALGPWVDVCWFGDQRWFAWNVEALRAYPGLTVTCANAMRERRNRPAWVHWMVRDETAAGLTKRPGVIRWNSNSGASAVNLALHFGAARVVLVGFDMRRTEGAPNDGHNYHDEHTPHHTPKKNVYDRFMKRWPAIAADAKRFGLEILNATPGSAIEEFPIVGLEDTL